MSGAAPVPVSLIEAYAEASGIEIHQVYGLTESCGPACLINPEDAMAKAGSTGKAFFHTEVRVVDDAGREGGAGRGRARSIIAGPAHHEGSTGIVRRRPRRRSATAGCYSGDRGHDG